MAKPRSDKPTKKATTAPSVCAKRQTLIAGVVVVLLLLAVAGWQIRYHKARVLNAQEAAPPAALSVETPASQMQARLTLPELTKAADYIIIGTVGSKRRAVSEDGGAVMLEVQLAVNEKLKGDVNGKKVTLKYKIASLKEDGEAVRIEDVPDLQIGKRVIVFHDGRQDAECPFVGGRQGVFLLTMKDTKSGFQVYTDTGEPVAKIEEGRVQIGATRTATPMSLKDFVEQVKAVK